MTTIAVNTTNIEKNILLGDIENLAFAHWQYKANEKAYANKLITKAMYEYARDKLSKDIDHLSGKCYTVPDMG